MQFLGRQKKYPVGSETHTYWTKALDREVNFKLVLCSKQIYTLFAKNTSF